jgi:hypothetical protein
VWWWWGNNVKVACDTNSHINHLNNVMLLTCREKVIGLAVYAESANICDIVLVECSGRGVIMLR